MFKNTTYQISWKSDHFWRRYSQNTVCSKIYEVNLWLLLRYFAYNSAENKPILIKFGMCTHDIIPQLSYFMYFL